MTPKKIKIIKNRILDQLTQLELKKFSFGNSPPPDLVRKKRLQVERKFGAVIDFTIKEMIKK